MINFLLFIVWACGLIGAALLDRSWWMSAICLLMSIAAGVAMAKRSNN